MTVNIGIDSFTISMSKRDLELFWMVLYGNIMNKLDSKVQVNERRVGTMAWVDEVAPAKTFPLGRPVDFCQGDKSRLSYHKYEHKYEH